MKKHNGMRPHDVAILLKIISKGQADWRMKDLSAELMISKSEISESLHRSQIAGLLSRDKHSPNRLALLDFLAYGFRYVYPQQPGGIIQGIATAHAASPLKDHFLSDEPYVWPHPKGEIRGQSIEPLHPKLPEACLHDAGFHELMALADALRVGKTRERQLALAILTERVTYA